jgi:hypothetical protein
MKHSPGRDDDQAWFWTEEWQAGERQVDEDIAAGRTIGPFYSAEEMFDALDKIAPVTGTD